MYELNKVGEHTYYINCPTNIGIFEYGGKVCFIDSGGDDRSAKEALMRIEEQGWVLDIIINTHCHADHCFGNAYLQEITGCRIFAPKADSAIISNPLINPTYLYGGFPCNEFHHRLLLAQPSVCEPITEDVLPEGLKYTYFNGHSFEMISIHTPDDVWFIADAVISEETIKGYPIPFLYNIDEHLSSLDKLLTLNGKLFIAAHCQPTEDISRLADVNRKNVFTVKSDILSLCINGLSVDELIEAVYSRYNIRPHVVNYPLVACTVRSYLAWLHNKGDIDTVFEGTKLLWKTM